MGYRSEVYIAVPKKADVYYIKALIKYIRKQEEQIIDLKEKL